MDGLGLLEDREFHFNEEIDFVSYFNSLDFKNYTEAEMWQLVGAVCALNRDFFNKIFRIVIKDHPDILNDFFVINSIKTFCCKMTNVKQLGADEIIYKKVRGEGNGRFKNLSEYSNFLHKEIFQALVSF